MYPPVSPCGYAVDLVRSCKRTRMRFWPGSDITAPVQWYYVPRDRPFLPLAEGWLWWDSERDPENEGMRRAAGEMVLGEDYLTDPTWARGKDPTHTRWVPGFFKGLPEWWRGEGIPEPAAVDLPPSVLDTLPFDCCSHFPIGPRCGTVFFPNGPSAFNLFIADTIVAETGGVGDFDIDAGVYTLPWVGLRAPCLWAFRHHQHRPPAPDPPTQTWVVRVTPEVVALTFESDVSGIIAIYNAPFPKDWDGLTPILLRLDPDGPNFNYFWPDSLTIAGVV